MSSQRQDFYFLPATSLGSSFNSPAVFVDADERFSMHLVYSGTPVGSFVLQFSNDNLTWATANGSTGDTTESITTAGDTLYVVSDNGVRWVRVAYTRTSGTGSVLGLFHSNDDR